MQKKKVIFLDIDGVLNRSLPPEDFTQYQTEQSSTPQTLLLPDCIEELNKIIRQTNAALVLSTDWRQWCSIHDLQRQLESAGCIGKVLGKTPVIDGIERGYEVMGWLHQFGDSVSAFVILDDRNDMGPYHKYLVQTRFDIGLTAELAIRAITILNTE